MTRWKTAAAFLMAMAYACAVLLLLQLHVSTFGYPRGFIFKDVAVALACLAVPLIALALARRTLARRLWIGLLAAVVFLHLLALVVEYFATIQISQNVSLAFLYDNWPAIAPFVPAWQLFPALAGLAVCAVLVALSVARVQAALGYRLSAMAVLLMVAGSAGLSLRYGATEDFFRDPLLGLLGYGERVQNTGRIVELTEAEVQARADYVPSAKRPKTNVIVFMADSINPSRLALFGHRRATNPFLDRMSKQYSHFDAAVGRSTCTDSVCGVLSALTSRSFVNTPPNGAFGIGQVLRRHGYKTHFVLVGDHRRFSYNYYWRFLEKEAGTIYDFKSSRAPLNSDRIAIEGLASLPQAGDEPALIFVFFFSAHMSGAEEQRFAKFGPFLANKRVLQRQKSLSPKEREAIGIHYDNKLVQLDDYMGRAWTTLEEKGYTDNSILLFLADHGEELGDNGHFGHTMFDLTENLVQIPVAMASNAGPVPDLKRATPQQIDVMPTLLDMLKLPAPHIWEGKSLFAKSPDAPVFHEFGVKTLLKGRECFAVVEAMANGRRGKYIRCRAPNIRTTRGFFDIDRDPLQRKNLWKTLTAPQQKSWDDKLDDHFRR